MSNTAIGPKFCEAKEKNKIIFGFILQKIKNQANIIYVPICVMYLIGCFMAVIDPLFKVSGIHKNYIGEETNNTTRLTYGYEPKSKFCGSEWDTNDPKIFTWMFGLYSGQQQYNYPDITIGLQTTNKINAHTHTYTFGRQSAATTDNNNIAPIFCDKHEVKVKFDIKKKTLKLWIDNEHWNYIINNIDVHEKTFTLLITIGSAGWKIRMLNCTINTLTTK
eukprot:364044_1